jgi:hypothetical protein
MVAEGGDVNAGRPSRSRAVSVSVSVHVHVNVNVDVNVDADADPDGVLARRHKKSLAPAGGNRRGERAARGAA